MSDAEGHREYSGEGFHLRALAPDDAALINRYETVNRLHLQRWEPLRDEQYFTVESTRARVEQQLENMQAASAMFFLMLEPDSGAIIGRCNYTNIVRGSFQACHLGFSLAEIAQGKGLMSNALQITNRYCFEQMGLHRIMANHLPRNLRSGRLLESLGFEKEGHARAYLKISGVWEDHILRSLINPTHTAF